MRWKEVEKKLLKKPGVHKAMEESRVENELADAIIEARLATGLTQAQLAKKIGTNQASISRLENGEANPRLSTLKKLADVLNMELRVAPTRRPEPEVRPSYARSRRPAHVPMTAKETRS
ncbi:MAG: helix-turn-helix domain-containing protein [Anaerolineae bacterium]